MVGGGIGGLSAALHLRNAGFDVTVFERRGELSEVNTGLSLWAFAVRRLDEMGLRTSLPDIGAPIERVVHRSVRDRPLGDVAVAPLSARMGAPSYEVHRSKLQRLLAAAVGDKAIRFNRRCVAVHQAADRVRVEFEEGGAAEADLLVGADGVPSAVRTAVRGRAELKRTAMGVWRGIAEVGREELSPGVHLRYVGPARLFGIARLSDELVRWYAAAPVSGQGPQSSAESKQGALSKFVAWPRLVVKVLERTAEHDYLFNDTPHAAPFRSWGVGRITLLGDAAHCSVPTLGVSAGLAIEDAAVLGDHVGAPSWTPSDLRAYEQQRQRVTARVVRAAALFGRVLMIRRQPAYGLRQAGIRLAPQALAIRWLIHGGS